MGERFRTRSGAIESVLEYSWRRKHSDPRARYGLSVMLADGADSLTEVGRGVVPVCLVRLMALRPLSCARRTRGCGRRLSVSACSNEDKDEVIAGLRSQLAEQAEQIARLERLISRNSGNSSMPPSGDDSPAREETAAAQAAAGRGRSGDLASSPGRQGRTCRGAITRTTQSRTSRRAPAGAAGTWPGPVISGSGIPTRSPTCPRHARKPSSTTGMRWSARAARCMSRVPRRKPGVRRAP